MQQGWSYEAIARDEGLSRERIRQIIKDALEGRDAEPSGDHQRLQLARLDPALRLAAEQVAAGDIKGIDRLIRVLKQMDKYQGAAEAHLARFDDEEDARERIFDKLKMLEQRKAAYAEDPNDARNRILAKLNMVDRNRAAYAQEDRASSAGAAGAGEGSEAAHESVSKFFRV
jgi:Sigma-70, region 4